MAGDSMRARMGVFLLVPALLFAALVGRLVYLNGAVYRLAASSEELDIEVVYQHPAPGEEEGLPVTGAGDYAQVPSLLNASFTEAGETLWQRGLRTEAHGELTGVVIKQEPAAHTRVKKGSTIKVWLETRAR